METNQKPILLKDLGTDKTRGYARFGLFKCPICEDNYKTEIRLVANNRSTKCKPCSTSITKNRTTHGKSKTKIYKTWLSMKKRCYNKKYTKYENWGGRGIVICDEWKDDFMAFYEWAIVNGYDHDLTIDRINNDGNYEPSNCRWANYNIQNANKRKPKNNTSGYIGVYKVIGNKFYAEVSFNDKTKNLGNFKTALEGAMARDQYIIDNNLEHTLNSVL